MKKLDLFRITTLGIAVASMVGCAHMPKSETVRYALPKAMTQITVTQTLGCRSDPSKAKSILSAVSVVPLGGMPADTC